MIKVSRLVVDVVLANKPELRCEAFPNINIDWLPLVEPLFGEETTQHKKTSSQKPKI